MVGYFTSFSFTNSCWKSRKVRKLKETLPNLVERISKKEVWESKSSNHLSSNISPTIRKDKICLSACQAEAGEGWRNSCIFTHEESQILKIFQPMQKFQLIFSIIFSAINSINSLTFGISGSISSAAIKKRSL